MLELIDNLLVFILILSIVGLPVALFCFATHDYWDEWREAFDRWRGE